MGFYIILNYGNYQVIDASFNRVVATFVSEIEAHKFLQSLLMNPSSHLPTNFQPINPVLNPQGFQNSSNIINEYPRITNQPPFSVNAESLFNYGSYDVNRQRTPIDHYPLNNPNDIIKTNTSHYNYHNENHNTKVFDEYQPNSFPQNNQYNPNQTRQFNSAFRDHQSSFRDQAHQPEVEHKYVQKENYNIENVTNRKQDNVDLQNHESCENCQSMRSKGDNYQNSHNHQIGLESELRDTNRNYSNHNQEYWAKKHNGGGIIPQESSNKNYKVPENNSLVRGNPNTDVGKEQSPKDIHKAQHWDKNELKDNEQFYRGERPNLKKTKNIEWEIKDNQLFEDSKESFVNSNKETKEIANNQDQSSGVTYNKKTYNMGFDIMETDELKTGDFEFIVENNKDKKNVSLFNDATISLDQNLLENDLEGAIIQTNLPILNNTDDDSLGEAALYKEKKQLNKTKIFEKMEKNPKVSDKISKNNESLVPIETIDLERAELENTQTSALNKSVILPINNHYISNPFLPKRDDSIIDLGPIDEDDTIFSTPRKDADSEELDNIVLTKKDKKLLKKAKKKDANNRKRLSKVLK